MDYHQADIQVGLLQYYLQSPKGAFKMFQNSTVLVFNLQKMVINDWLYSCTKNTCDNAKGQSKWCNNTININYENAFTVLLPIFYKNKMMQGFDIIFKLMNHGFAFCGCTPFAIVTSILMDRNIVLR